MSTYDDMMDISSDKGKGKADDSTVADHLEEEGEEETSDDETVDEHVVPQDVEEDNFNKNDTENILPDRTRGRNIDYSKVDPADLQGDDDEDDDEDFHEKTDVDTVVVDDDRMEH